MSSLCLLSENLITIPPPPISQSASKGRILPDKAKIMMEEEFTGVGSGQSGLLVDSFTSSSSNHPTSIENHSSYTPRGHNRIPNASSVGNRLYTHGNSSYGSGSRHSSFNSDIEHMSVSDAELHSEISDISTQVQRIQQQLSSMEENHLSSDEKHGRLKSDNAVLQERLDAMEEQMRATEERWREKYNHEKQRAKELLERMEREKLLEIESWSLKHQLLDKETTKVKSEQQKLADEVTVLENENSSLEDKLDDAQFRLQTAEEQGALQKKELAQLQEESSLNHQQSSEIIADLKRENEELMARPRQMSIANRAEDIALELARVQEELREEKARTEELNSELLQAQVNAGQDLLSSIADTAGPSLAEEMHGKDKTELLNSLRDQEVCNQKLRIYIDGILTRVIEKYPEILEISQ